MFNMEQKDYHPDTYKLIKELTIDGNRSFRKLCVEDTFNVIGVFLEEALLRSPSETFFEVIQNEHISKLLCNFFTQSNLQTNFKSNLFILVSQEFEDLFEELFDEAYEDTKRNLIEEYESIMGTQYQRYLKAI